MAHRLHRRIPRSSSYPPHPLHLSPFAQPSSNLIPDPFPPPLLQTRGRNPIHPPLLRRYNAGKQHLQKQLPLLGAWRPKHRLLDLPTLISHIPPLKPLHNLPRPFPLPSRRAWKPLHAHRPARSPQQRNNGTGNPARYSFQPRNMSELHV